MLRKTACALGLLLFVAAAIPLPARQEGASTPGPHGGLFSEMRWRNIGPLSRRPHQGGRRRAEPALHVLHRHGERRRVEDHRRRAAPGSRSSTTSRPDRSAAVAVAPSDPNIIYVGSGEGLPRPDLAVGDGIYKSTDAGKTWTHLGLRDAQQIPKHRDRSEESRTACSSPRSAIPTARNEERGIFRSTDGGETFERVLFKDENTGGKDVDIDPSNPDIVYATMWEERQGPWENGAWGGTNGGIFKSTDGGTTWKQLTQGAARRHRSTPSWRSRRAIRSGSTRMRRRLPPQAQPVRGGNGGRGRSWRSRRRAAPRSIARTMPARRGRASTTRRVGTQQRSGDRTSIRRIPTR